MKMIQPTDKGCQQSCTDEVAHRVSNKRSNPKRLPNARRFKPKGLYIAILGLAATVQVSAQQPSGEGARTEEGARTIEEIVVSSSRREDALSRVPISVQAFTQDMADAQGIRDINDIARFTPGLEIRQGLGSSSNISIRGVRSGIGAATTGIYIDDTPIQVRATGFASGNVYPRLFDLERVEVLRGPQGTLYGAGSQGGNVRFITPSPHMDGPATMYIRGSQWQTHGGDPGHEIGVAGGAPIIEGVLGFRASAFTQTHGGYISRVHPITGDVEAKNQNWDSTNAYRVALGYALNDSVTITPSYFYQEIKLGDGGRFWVTNPYDSSIVSRKGNFISGDRVNGPTEDKFHLPSLNIEVGLQNMVLSSNTSYFTRDYHITNDYSNLVLVLLPVAAGNVFGLPAGARRSVAPLEHIPGYHAEVQWFGDQSVFSQELQLQSDMPESRLSWTAGIYYMESDLENKQYIFDPYIEQIVDLWGYDGTVEEVLGMPVIGGEVYGFHPSRSISYATEDYSRDRQLAVFAELEYDITDRLTGIFGLRWSDSEFLFRNLQTGPWNAETTTAGGSFSESPVTPKIGLTYDLDDRSMVYATAAEGFRQGGANRAVSAVRCRTQLDALGLDEAPSGFDSDSVWSYELGIKSTGLFGGRANVGLSVFQIDWDGIQQSVGLTGCGFSFISNLGSATNRGFDLDATVLATDRLTVNFSLGYLDSKYNEDIESLGVLMIRQKGDSLPVEEWQGNLGLRYDFSPVFSGMVTPYMQLNYSYNGEYQNTPQQGSAGFDAALFMAPARRQADLRFGAEYDQLRVQLSIENLTNSTDPRNIGRATGGSPIFREQIARPRTIGLSATYRY